MWEPQNVQTPKVSRAEEPVNELVGVLDRQFIHTFCSPPPPCQSELEVLAAASASLNGTIRPWMGMIRSTRRPSLCTFCTKFAANGKTGGGALAGGGGAFAAGGAGGL